MPVPIKRGTVGRVTGLDDVTPHDDGAVPGIDAGPGLERWSIVPLYLQIEEELRGLIRSGQLAEFSRIPSEWELSRRFQVSRMTARKAVDRLVADGALLRRPGKGTFVARRRIPHGASQQLSFSAAMRELSLPLSTRVLEVQEIPAPRSVADALEIAGGASVILIRRLRIVAEEPAAIHTSYFGAHFSYLRDADLTGSLSDIMAAHGDRVAHASDFIEAVVASGDEARLLGVSPRSPLVRIVGVAFSAVREALRYSEGLYRGDRFRFAANTAAAQELRMVFQEGQALPVSPSVTAVGGPPEVPRKKTSRRRTPA
jgi:GntR family transcriptional regulator